MRASRVGLLAFVAACGAPEAPIAETESEISVPGGASLRIVGLNIGGLRWDKTQDEYGLRVTNQSSIDGALTTFMRNEVARSSAIGARTVFALQEVSRHCDGTNNPGDNYAVAANAVFFSGSMSTDPCGVSQTGTQGNAILTDATILGSASLNFTNESCHRLSAHAMKVRAGSGLAAWVVSTHLDLDPPRARDQLRAVMDWLRGIAGRDWTRTPIIITGDFNLAAQGRDLTGGEIVHEWEQTICPGDDDEKVVTAEEHRDVLAQVAADTAARGFVQVIGARADPHVWSGASWHAWDERRRVDFAFVRNPPCETCVTGHRTPPKPGPFFFTDHTGLVITVLPPAQAAQRAAKHAFLVR